MVRVLRGLLLEEREPGEMLREGLQRPAAGEREVGATRLQSLVLLAVVGDVLADALLASTLEVDDRRLAQEVGACLELEPFELVAFDLERPARGRRRTGSSGRERYRDGPGEPSVGDRQLAVHLTRATARALVQEREHEGRDGLS